MLQYERHKWRNHIFTLKGSVLPLVLPRVCFFAVYSALIAYAYKRAWIGTIPPLTHMVLGTVLGLMLAFRTNASYDRWWEGRKAWGVITNRCRDLMRQALGSQVSSEQHLHMGKLLAAFAHAAKRQLFREAHVPELERLLGAAAMAEMMHQPGPALRLVERLSAFIYAHEEGGRIKANLAHRMDQNITELIEQMGVCQRIQRSPIPFAYVVHLQRFLLLYCATLPFALVDALGYTTPAVVMLVGYAMFGVEEIGVQIEDPFVPSANDVDLERITHSIERDVMALAGTPQKEPVSVAPPPPSRRT